MSKQALCISYTNYSNKRMKYVREAFESLGYEVTFYTSDFNHYTKTYYELHERGTVQIHVPPYKRNLSISRIASYYIFAKKIYAELNKIQPDVIYDLIPPNSVVRACAKYKRTHKTKLVFDVFDLWPETFPYKKNIIFAIPFGIWKNIRDKNISAADAVLFECNLFADKLKDITKNSINKTVYISSENADVDLSETHVKTNEINEVNIGYLGSINNIIDIETIISLLTEVKKNKEVVLHIIGEGEKRDELIGHIESAAINVIYYGKVYDEKEKADIFAKCDYALNIMRSNVCIGLSMKTPDYLKMGVPIINNLQSDTYELVKKYNVGINIDNSDISKTAKAIASTDINDNLKMRRNARALYEKLFSPDIFKQNLIDAFKELEE